MSSPPPPSRQAKTALIRAHARGPARAGAGGAAFLCPLWRLAGSHLSGGPLRGLAPLALVASRFFLPAIFFAQFNALWPVRPVPHRFETVFLCVLYNCMQILFNLWCLREARSPVSILRLRLLSHPRQNQEIPEMRSLIENLSNANHL